MAVFILLLVICLVVGFAVSKTSAYSKRGCGRGCPTCGNRFICHPGQYSKKEDKDS